MRLYSGKIPQMSDEIVRALEAAKAVEFESRSEVIKDVESVFSSYQATDRQVSERARDLGAQRNLPPSEIARIRAIEAERKGIKVGDDMLDHLLDQLIEMLMHSNNVDEVFGEDHDLRRTMRPVLRKHLDEDAQVDIEVRSKLKHVQEGTRTWEVEYQRVMADIQRRRGLV
jgi:hypothetical protein